MSLAKYWQGAPWTIFETATIEKHEMQGLCSMAVLMAADAVERYEWRGLHVVRRRTGFEEICGKGHTLGIDVFLGSWKELLGCNLLKEVPILWLQMLPIKPMQ